MLLVDDSALVRLVTRQYLETWGYQVVEAEDGLAAIEVMKDLAFDVVLSDFQMPRMNGLELVRHLQAENPNLPVVLFTSVSSLETGVEALRAGAFDYVMKENLEAEGLRSELHMVIERALQWRELQAERIRLVEQLQASLEEIRGLNENLEKTVEARTHELRQALKRERNLTVEKGKMIHYLPTQVVDDIQRNREAKLALGGRPARAAVLFCDIRGFTPLAEREPPERTVRILNDFMTRMAAAVDHQGGIVDKFLGDGIMAVFLATGASPGHCDRAVQAGLEMLRSMEGFNEKWQEEGLHSIEIRVGIAAGDMIAGNIGSETRMDFTVIGDVVNLASRLERRAEPGTIMVSNPVRESLSVPVSASGPTPLQVRGKSVRVETWTLHP